MLVGSMWYVVCGGAPQTPTTPLSKSLGGFAPHLGGCMWVVCHPPPHVAFGWACMWCVGGGVQGLACAHGCMATHGVVGAWCHHGLGVLGGGWGGGPWASWAWAGFGHPPHHVHAGCWGVLGVPLWHSWGAAHQCMPWVSGVWGGVVVAFCRNWLHVGTLGGLIGGQKATQTPIAHKRETFVA